MMSPNHGRIYLCSLEFIAFRIARLDDELNRLAPKNIHPSDNEEVHFELTFKSNYTIIMQQP
jgi:hypothetical protein